MGCLLFVIIMVPHGIIVVTVEVEVCWAVLIRIPCNRAVQRVPGGVFCTGGLASEGVRVIWYHR